MFRFIVAGAIALAAASCAWDNGRQLATPVDGNPCGNAWHPCFEADNATPNGACCGNGDACGGGPFNGCPTASCCPTGEGDALAGVSLPYPQRSAR